jgi:hypothetical protein
MSSQIDFDADLENTIFDDFETAGTWKQRTAASFAPASGTATPTWNEVSVNVVKRPLKVSQIERSRSKGGNLQVLNFEASDVTFLIRADELGIEPGDEDVLVVGSVTYTVVDWELIDRDALYRVVMRPQASG